MIIVTIIVGVGVVVCVTAGGVYVYRLIKKGMVLYFRVLKAFKSYMYKIPMKSPNETVLFNLTCFLNNYFQYINNTVFERLYFIGI